MIMIDKYAYSSQLSRISPKAKIFFSMVPLIICIGFNSMIVSSFTLAIMALATVKFGRIKLARYARLLCIPGGFLILGTLTILINRFDPEHGLILGVRIGQFAYGIDRNSLITALGLILKALGSVSCMYFLSLNTPMSDLFQTLGKTRLPAVIVTLMELIYMYIFILLEEAARMNIAKDSRLGNCNFRTALKSMGELAGMLFIRAYQRADRAYAALESRGYNGQMTAFDDDYICSRKMNMASIAVISLLLCIGILQMILF